MKRRGVGGDEFANGVVTSTAAIPNPPSRSSTHDSSLHLPVRARRADLGRSARRAPGGATMAGAYRRMRPAAIARGSRHERGPGLGAPLAIASLRPWLVLFGGEDSDLGDVFRTV